MRRGLTAIGMALGMAAAASSAWGDTVVVTADHMVDVISGRLLDRPQITITDGRISAVATQGAAIPAGARRIELPGLTLLPGLIDMHVHLTSDPTLNSGYRGLEVTDNYWTVVGVANAQAHARGGIHHRAQRRFEQLRRRRAQAGHRARRHSRPAHRACNLRNRGDRRSLRRQPSFRPRSRRPRCPVANGPDASAGHGAQIAQVRRRGHQVLRHRRRIFEDRSRSAGSSSISPKCRPSWTRPTAGSQGGRARAWHGGHQGRHPRRRRHGGTRQPGRRGSLRPRQTTRHLFFDGHLRR